LIYVLGHDVTSLLIILHPSHPVIFLPILRNPATPSYPYPSLHHSPFLVYSSTQTSGPIHTHPHPLLFMPIFTHPSRSAPFLLVLIHPATLSHLYPSPPSHPATLSHPSPSLCPVQSHPSSSIPVIPLHHFHHLNFFHPVLSLSILIHLSHLIPSFSIISHLSILSHSYQSSSIPAIRSHPYPSLLT
jgi:hypothetical protein